MKEKAAPDERTGPTTETATSTPHESSRQPAEKLAPPTVTDNDTEGQGGKVFAIDQAEAEDAAGH
jgi:hypothetical protein